MDSQLQRSMFNIVKQFFSKHVLNVHPNFRMSSMSFCEVQYDPVDRVLQQLVTHLLHDFLQSMCSLA